MLSTIWQAALRRATPVLLTALACACTVIDKAPVPAVPVGPSAAVTSTSQLPGADLAYSINRRYAQTPGKCFVASPAFDCSGVMLRPAPAGGADTPFWQIGADETNAGYARLSYARQDLPAVTLSASVGFVLADRPTAAGNGQPYDYVCGKAPLAQSLPPCPGNADAVGVSLWNVGNPAALAVQAIYYDVANGGQLSQALRYQKQYYDATGQWMPVLKATIGAGAATAFGFDERDQLDWGFTVAKQLEARHADTRMTCPGNTAGYNCSGVLIRITGCGDFHSWNPSQNSVDRNGVSFSFARVDMLMNATHSGGPGIIMRELQAPTQYPLTWRCEFPVNAGTSSRPSSCGTGTATTPDLRLCDARGINTAAQWLTTHGGAPAGGCALSPSVAQFAVFKELRQTYSNAHNEVVIAAWPQNIPDQLPIDAWFYPTLDAKPGAQYIQQDYMEVTGHFMPVLQVVLTNPAGSIYRYHVADQTGAINTGALLAAPDNWAACQSR
ncbi:hypothetical protein PAN31117_03590 [Pandoraea anapnoica]|uniref:Uncharacterized protein n=1 Tax=Pandoraea anapnoica TaxID=2508301 RepID=A0A5E5ACG6_9BURK|nr:hypothetical protein [Pandoraea anapnoica]VVE70203.1 hypothetical protein PAN31117_03590 [Pandoraea anapnoica]